MCTCTCTCTCDPGVPELSPPSPPPGERLLLSVEYPVASGEGGSTQGGTEGEVLLPSPSAPLSPSLSPAPSPLDTSAGALDKFRKFKSHMFHVKVSQFNTTTIKTSPQPPASSPPSPPPPPPGRGLGRAVPAPAGVPGSPDIPGQAGPAGGASQVLHLHLHLQLHLHLHLQLYLHLALHLHLHLHQVLVRPDVHRGVRAGPGAAPGPEVHRLPEEVPLQHSQV